MEESNSVIAAAQKKTGMNMIAVQLTSLGSQFVAGMITQGQYNSKRAELEKRLHG